MKVYIIFEESGEYDEYRKRVYEIRPTLASAEVQKCKLVAKQKERIKARLEALENCKTTDCGACEQWCSAPYTTEDDCTYLVEEFEVKN